MGHDRFGIGIEIPLVAPVVPVAPLVQEGYPQPGYPPVNPGYAPGMQQQMDPLRGEAFHIAQELRAGQTGQALQEIRAEVYRLDPRNAVRFSDDLQQATAQMGVQDPLRRGPEVVRDPYSGQMRPDGNEALYLTDPYSRQTQEIKQIHHQPIAQPGYVQPGYAPGYAPAVPSVGVEIGVGNGRRY